jgi:hypothetical protein
MSETTIDQLEVNGIKYVRQGLQTTPQPNGNRAVLVIDRGWIFAGDVTEKNGRVYLTRVVHVVGWDSIGFDGMLEDPKSSKVRLKLVDNIDFPADAELFRSKVNDTWGI